MEFGDGGGVELALAGTPAGLVGEWAGLRVGGIVDVGIQVEDGCGVDAFGVTEGWARGETVIELVGVAMGSKMAVDEGDAKPDGTSSSEGETAAQVSDAGVTSIADGADVVPTSRGASAACSVGWASIHDRFAGGVQEATKRSHAVGSANSPRRTAEERAMSLTTRKGIPLTPSTTHDGHSPIIRASRPSNP